MKRAPDVRTGDHRLDLRTPDGRFAILAVQGCDHLEIQAIVVVPDPWGALPGTPVGPWLERAARGVDHPDTRGDGRPGGAGVRLM